MPVYRIESNTNYVEADNRRSALTYARKQVTAESVGSRDIVDLGRRGVAIIDAATGEAIDAGSPVPDNQEAIDFPKATGE